MTIQVNRLCVATAGVAAVGVTGVCAAVESTNKRKQRIAAFMRSLAFLFRLAGTGIRFIPL
jgi:hypothetical protein